MKFCLLLLFTLAVFSASLASESEKPEGSVIAAVEGTNEDAQENMEEEFEEAIVDDLESGREKRSIFFNSGHAITQHLSRKVREAIEQLGSRINVNHNWQKTFQLF